MATVERVSIIAPDEAMAVSYEEDKAREFYRVFTYAMELIKCVDEFRKDIEGVVTQDLFMDKFMNFNDFVLQPVLERIDSAGILYSGLVSAERGQAALEKLREELKTATTEASKTTRSVKAKLGKPKGSKSKKAA